MSNQRDDFQELLNYYDLNIPHEIKYNSKEINAVLFRYRQELEKRKADAEAQYTRTIKQAKIDVAKALYVELKEKGLYASL